MTKTQKLQVISSHINQQICQRQRITALNLVKTEFGSEVEDESNEEENETQTSCVVKRYGKRVGN